MSTYRLPRGKHVIHVNARRWNDRDGNTYHSVSVMVDGEHVGTAPFTYGYGDHFTHTAGVLLGLPDPYDAGRWAWAQDSGHKMTYDVVDVPRRRDLHNGGR